MTHTFTTGNPCSWCAVIGGQILGLLTHAEADSFLVVGECKRRGYLRTSLFSLTPMMSSNTWNSNYTKASSWQSTNNKSFKMQEIMIYYMIMQRFATSFLKVQPFTEVSWPIRIQIQDPSLIFHFHNHTL
jgi:hypothetical protein